MKQLIKELLRKQITKHCIITEGFESVYDWYEYHMEEEREIFDMIKRGEKITFRLMPANQYHHALKEFMQYGTFMRFPEKYVFQWKTLLLENISKLSILTEIVGHTSQFPFDEFYNTFDYNNETHNDRDGEFSQWCQMKYEETGDEQYTQDYNFISAYEFLDEVYHIDDVLPLFSNGQWVLSDFGLEPLMKLGEEIVRQKDPNEIIVTINKILDVSHQRSDLAELFIEGGSRSLDFISNS